MCMVLDVWFVFIYFIVLYDESEILFFMAIRI